MQRAPLGLPLPQVPTLAQLAALRVPYAQIEFMDVRHGVVINFELGPYIHRVGRWNRTIPLDELCDCQWDGDCL